MRTLKYAVLGALIGAGGCGLGLLGFLTRGNPNYFQQVGEQSPLSILALGAIPGIVLGLIVGIVMSFTRRKRS